MLILLQLIPSRFPRKHKHSSHALRAQDLSSVPLCQRQAQSTSLFTVTVVTMKVVISYLQILLTRATKEYWRCENYVSTFNSMLHLGFSGNV